MFVKNIVVKFSQKRLWVIIASAVLVAIVLITISIIAVSSVARNRYKDGYQSIVEALNKENVFNATSYYTEYEATTISNKNRNVYVVKEWFTKKDENNLWFKFEMTNSLNQTIVYIIKDNTLTVKNYDQINVYVINNYMTKTTNLMSIYTFVSLYKSLEEQINIGTPSNLFVINNSVDDSKIHLNIEFELNNALEERTVIYEKYSDILSYGLDIKNIELQLDKKSNLPNQINIFDSKSNIYLAITYKFFKINEKFEDKVFAI